MFKNVEAALKKTPIFSLLPHPRAVAEAKGWKGVEGGWFLPEYGGGGKLAQILATRGDWEIGLSDRGLGREGSLLTLFVLGGGDVRAAVDVVKGAGLPKGLLTEKGIEAFHDRGGGDGEDEAPGEGITIRPAIPFDAQASKGCRPSVFVERLGKASYAIIRPDFYIVALLQTPAGLQQALSDLKGMISDPEPVQHRNTISKL